MPERVRITSAEVPDTIAKILDPEDPVSRFIIDHFGESDERSWVMLVNSFATVDEDYVAALMSFYQPDARACLVGPMSLAAGDMPEREEDHDSDGSTRGR
jgi:hypothetical protein